MSARQPSLLDPISTLPDGFEYREGFVSAAEEAELVSHITRLELREFEFHGYLGRRRVTSFGLRYDFNVPYTRPPRCRISSCRCATGPPVSRSSPPRHWRMRC